MKIQKYAQNLKIQPKLRVLQSLIFPYISEQSKGIKRIKDLSINKAFEVSIKNNKIIIFKKES